MSNNSDFTKSLKYTPESTNNDSEEIKKGTERKIVKDNLKNLEEVCLVTVLADEKEHKFLNDTLNSYNEKFNSQTAQEYLHNLVASILIEHHKLFPNYKLEAHYRFKSQMSLANKIISYMKNKYKNEKKKNPETRKRRN